MGSAVLVLLITVLKEKIGSDLAASIAKAVIVSVVIGAWIYELRIRNLRSKTSKLEGEIHSLRVSPSPAIPGAGEGRETFVSTFGVSDFVKGYAEG